MPRVKQDWLELANRFDKLLVEQRLEKLRRQSAGSEAETEIACMVTPQAQARNLEIAPVSTLADTDSKVWTLTRDGCLTSDCKRHIPEAR